MCDAIRYWWGKELASVQFTIRRASLPVRMKEGKFQLRPWGRRKGEPGKLPFGGTVKQEAVHAGMWDRFMPLPVKIPYQAYMIRNFEGRETWHDNVWGPTHYIQGLLAREGNEHRVYIITIEPDVIDSEFVSVMPKMVHDLNLRSVSL